MPNSNQTETDPLAQKILSKLDEQKKAIAEIEKNVAKNSETKAEAEALQKAVADYDGLSADVKAVADAMEKLQGKLAHVRREASGDPKARIVNDTDMRAMLVAGAKSTYLRKSNRDVPDDMLDAARALEDVATGRALSGGSAPGSTYIGEELITTVYQLIGSYGVWNGFDVYRPGARTVRLPVDTSDPSMLAVTESTEGSEASWNGTTKTINVKDVRGWIAVPNSVLDDDEIGLANHILTKFSRAVAKRLDYFCIAADGTDDGANGAQTGIVAGGTQSGIAATKVAWSDLTYDMILAHVAGADEALLSSPTTRWWMHPSVLVRLLGIKDINGRPIFLTSVEAPSVGGLGSILGYPVVTSGVAPKTAGATLPIAVYGDANGLAVALRRDLEFASSTEAKFINDQTIFRAKARVGCVVRNASAFEVLKFGAAN